MGGALVRAAWWLACAGVVAAKPLPVPFQSEFQAENWDLEDGFPENSCSGIVAGPDGYLWIATFRGLVRFNGQSFKKWGPPAMPGLRSTGILSLHRDRSGRIWMSTMDGLVTNSGDVWRKWSAAEGWDDAADQVRSYAENAAGQLVLTRYSGRVQRLENGRFQNLPLPPGTGGTLAGLDAEGGLYVFRAGHALWFNDGAWQRIEGGSDLGARAVGATQSRDGHAIIITRDELARVRGGRVVSRVKLTLPVASFWHPIEDAAGVLWLPAVDVGLYRIKQDGTVQHFRKADGLPHGGGTRAVHASEDGSYWIGSGVGGLTRLRPTRFRYLGDDEGMGDREVLTLTQLADGRMLFAPYGSGLKVFDGKNGVEQLRLGVNVPLYCRALLRTRDGALWMGAYGAGLGRYHNGKLEQMAAGLLAGGKESVHSLFEDSQGRLWVGGERSVLWGKDGVFERVALPDRNAGRRTFFAERPDGTILIGQRHEIYVFDQSGLRPEPIVRMHRDTRISTLLPDGRGRLWIGTADHSLSVLHNGEVKTLPAGRGLPGPTIAALVQDDRGQLWFGAGRSVVRADPEELWAAMNDSTRELRMLRFGRDDGIRALDFTFGTQPNVMKDDEGRLWFALIRGAAMIDPATVTLNDRPPRVVVESVSFVPDGAKQAVELPVVAGQPGPVLPAGSRLIRIHYAALDFFAPRKQRFRVALDGEWQDMMADPVVSFLELPPGRHTLRVVAAGSDGVWNREGATLAFTITPFYWQTGWFRGLLAVAVVGLVGGGVWLVTDRRTRIAREKLERERRLAEAQARLALVLENTSDFVAFADEAGKLVYLNRAGRALLGFEATAELGASSLNTILPAWAQEQHRRVALPAAVAEGTWSGESALLQRGGREVPVSQVLIAHRAPDGKLDFTSMIARDISVAKRHAAVQEALRRLATALTAALDARSLGRAVAEACRTMFAHDAFFLLLLDDAKEVSLNAYMEDTPMGRNGPEPMQSEIRRVSPLMRPVLEGKPLVINRETADADVPGTVPFGDKERRSLSILYAPVRWEGRTIGVVSAQSYTVRRYGEADLEQLETLANHCAAAIARLHAEELLRKNEEQLRQSQKLEAVGTLAGGIAHDFNNILTAILGNAELATFDLGRAHPAREFLDKIRQSGLRARDLVRRILAFSRPQDAEAQATAPTPVVDEVVKLLRATIPAIVEISAHAEGTVPPVDIDSTELHQVLLNLGTNAAHAIGQQPGRIEFRLDACTVEAGVMSPAPGLAPGRYARIAVTDTGCGIAPEVLPRIFDPFFTTKGPGEGSGLGLSVAHGIIRARGGAITVTSQPGAGATFLLHLPVSSAMPGATPVLDTPAPFATAGRGHRLLVVDDEEMIVATMRAVFTRAGFVVESFMTPAAALAAFRREPEGYDLVVTDLAMPGMSGVTLAQELRRLRPDLPVVLLSGYMRTADREAAQLAGVREIVEKPVTPQGLLPAVTRLLGEGKR